MAIQYVDANRQNTTFVPTNKQDLIDNIETVLLAAGWTTISGHATTTLVMQSATTPQGLNMQIKVKDNAGTCVTISIQNVAGTKVGNNSTTQGLMLNPGASTKTYRIVANKYQAFIWTGAPTPAREFVAFGVPYIPTFLVGVVTEAIWGVSNSASDTNAVVYQSWRGCLRNGNVGNTICPNCQSIINGNIWENANTPSPSGSDGRGWPTVVPPLNDGGTSTNHYRWHDLSANFGDAIYACGLTGANAIEGILRGQLWDAIASTEMYGGDLTTSFDSHNWIVITDSGVGLGDLRGTLFIAIP